ncbi:MAG: hypothetical protein H6722_23440 [Sandaracinus sp.]|nr:hypothetical protein [Sandaracinus sp.]
MLRILPVLLIAALLTTVTRSEAMSTYLGAQSYEDVYYLPSPAWLRVFSLGHEEAAADLLWMQSLVYVGDEYVHHGDVENVYRYADAVVTLDPDFRRAYSWAATMGLYRPVAPTIDEGLEAVAFLQRAVARFPEDGELVWELAAAYSYELPSLTDDAEEKRRFRGIGADHMVTAARMGAGPPWLALSNASRLESLGRIDQAVHHLEEMYAVVGDETTRQEIATRLEGLRAQASAEALRASERDLHARASRDFPWVPVDFYVLLGDRVVPATD